MNRSDKSANGDAPATDILPRQCTIVISTGERSAMVYKCLRSLGVQGVPPDVEVVIVDAGRSDPVDEQTARSIWPNLCLLKAAEPNLTKQRNAGTRRASGEFVCFLDDDTLVQPGWWPAIIEPMCGKPETGNLRPESEVRSQNEEGDGGQRSEVRGQRSEVSSQKSEGGDQRSEDRSQSGTSTPILRHTHTPTLPPRGSVAIVAGAVWCNPSPAFTDKPGGYVSWLGIPSQVTHRSRNAPREVEWPVGCNMAFRKSVWEELGGLCELYGFYDEDIDFGMRARRAGYRVVFAPEAAVYHYCNTRPKVPMTKHKAFLMGRNRCMTLARNDGVSLRLLAYLLTAPWIRLWEALREIGLQCKTSLGHWAAHGAGVVAGLFMGWRHPPRRDAWTKAE